MEAQAPTPLSLEQKIDAIYVSVEKMRRYMLWTAIITVGLIVIPLLLLPLALPAFLTSQGVGSVQLLQGL